MSSCLDHDIDILVTKTFSSYHFDSVPLNKVSEVIHRDGGAGHTVTGEDMIDYRGVVLLQRRKAI